MIRWIKDDPQGPDAGWEALIDRWTDGLRPGGRILIVPPDITRGYSFAGKITAYLYEKLHRDHTVHVMPAVGTHRQMTAQEREAFFPCVPADVFWEHRWQTDAVDIGTIPRDFVERISHGMYREPIAVQVNRRLLREAYDAILSVGQVVPHEVAGMANYSKNILVGLGGRGMINHSHMVGAVCNLEKCMGNVDTPVRALFDYAQDHFLDRLAITYFLTVTTVRGGEAELQGLFIGAGRDAFENAASLSRQTNITFLKQRVPAVVAYLEPSEFRSAWVGNKAIYRTRMAIADGGELVILAPGLRQFGENEEADQCIRRYGYCGTEKILSLYRENAFAGLEMVAAHLIHGSSEGRFRIVYATDPALLGQKEIESVGFRWANVHDLLRLYQPTNKETGVYSLNGKPYYFVGTPAMGLWRTGPTAAE